MATWCGSASDSVAVHIDTVWEIVRFSGLHKWDPNSIFGCDIVEGDGCSEGSVRCVTFKYSDGSSDTLYERLLSYDEDEYSYSYALETNPFGYENYESTLTLEEDGNGGTHVQWSFELDAIEDCSEDYVVGLIEDIFQRRISLIEEAAYN